MLAPARRRRRLEGAARDGGGARRKRKEERREGGQADQHVQQAARWRWFDAAPGLCRVLSGRTRVGNRSCMHSMHSVIPALYLDPVDDLIKKSWTLRSNFRFYQVSSGAYSLQITQYDTHEE